VVVLKCPKKHEDVTEGKKKWTKQLKGKQKKEFQISTHDNIFLGPLLTYSLHIIDMYMDYNGVRIQFYGCFPLNKHSISIARNF